MKKTILIFGSSRSNGNTFAAVTTMIKPLKDVSFIDLANYNVADYDYDFKNQQDDFMGIVEQLIAHDTIILATPIYWYTMSAAMKRFIDRISDLLSANKDQGRLLRNKNLAVISSYSVHPEGKDGFEQIFINISNYLGMNYLGCYFHYSGEDENILAVNKFVIDEFNNRLNLIKDLE